MRPTSCIVGKRIYVVFSMTTDKGIFIQNIYYMLSYAYQVLQQQDYQCIASEKFEHIDDLFAAILAKGVFRQLKQGLYREYVSRSETRRSDSFATKRNLVEILRFTLFSRHVVFDGEGDKLRNKRIENHITVSVVIDMECGNTKKLNI